MTKEQQRSIWELINQSQELSDDIQEFIDEYESGEFEYHYENPINGLGDAKINNITLRFENINKLSDWISDLQQKGITDL